LFSKGLSKQIVFHDESLQRWKIPKHIGIIAALIGAVVSAVFVVSLLVIPSLVPAADVTNRPKKLARIFPARQSVKYEAKLKNYMLKRIGSQFRETFRRGKKCYDSKDAGAQKSKIVVAFYSTWQESGIHSLRAHSD